MELALGSPDVWLPPDFLYIISHQLCFQDGNQDDYDEEDEGMDEFEAWYWTEWNFPLMVHHHLQDVDPEYQFEHKFLVRKDEKRIPTQMYGCAFYTNISCYVDEEDFHSEFGNDPQAFVARLPGSAFSLAGRETQFSHILLPLALDRWLEETMGPPKINPDRFLNLIPPHRLWETFRLAFYKSSICKLMQQTLEPFSPEFPQCSNYVGLTCTFPLAFGIPWLDHPVEDISPLLERLYDDPTRGLNHATPWWDSCRSTSDAALLLTAPDSGVTLLMILCSCVVISSNGKGTEQKWSTSISAWLIANHLRIGFDINARDIAGNTALTYARASISECPTMAFLERHLVAAGAVV